MKQTNLRKFYVDEEIKRKNRDRIVNLMTADRETWFDQKNLDNKIRNDVIIPENALEMTDYYSKLQQQATN